MVILRVENNLLRMVEITNLTKTDASQRLTTCTTPPQDSACKIHQPASCTDRPNSLGSYGRTTPACSL